MFANVKKNYDLYGVTMWKVLSHKRPKRVTKTLWKAFTQRLVLDNQEFSQNSKQRQGFDNGRCPGIHIIPVLFPAVHNSWNWEYAYVSIRVGFCVVVLCCTAMREAFDCGTATGVGSHAFFLYVPGRDRPAMKRTKPMKIGERIKEVFMTLPKDCDVNWFARQLHCDRRNVYRIFNKENIDIDMLCRISQILNHDFFKDLSEKYNSPEKDNTCDI